MTEILFYSHVENKFHTACEISNKVLRSKRKMMVFAQDEAAAAKIDRLLWTIPALGFLPHCVAGHPLAAETPIVISCDPDKLVFDDVLLNLHDEVQPLFSRYQRVIEIVSTDAADAAAARARYKFYKDRGYSIISHNLSKKPG
ncbi:MAG: DNA polymerase III subunit chi [Burkholderiales bacterium]